VYAQFKKYKTMLEIINKNLLSKIVFLIEQAKEKAVRSVDHERTLMYWQIGEYIVEEER
jgi:hypothetical protein